MSKVMGIREVDEVSRLNELIIEGEELLSNLKEEKNIDINRWISESLLYAEGKYSKTEFVKFFISDVEVFRASMIGYSIYDKECFERLVSHLNAISNYQIALKKEQEEKLDAFRNM